MSETYKIREAHVQVSPNVTIIVELNSLDAVKQLITDFSKHGLLPVEQIKITQSKTQQSFEAKVQDSLDTPIARAETRAGVPKGSFASTNILAYKDDIPQLIKPAVFGAVSDAALVLLFSVEAGLKKSSIDYEAFKGLYESQNIKSGSSLPMLLNNLKNANYIDKKAYNTDRIVRLTAKGERRAIDVLKEVCKQS